MVGKRYYKEAHVVPEVDIVLKQCGPRCGNFFQHDEAPDHGGRFETCLSAGKYGQGRNFHLENELNLRWFPKFCPLKNV